MVRTVSSLAPAHVVNGRRVKVEGGLLWVVDTELASNKQVRDPTPPESASDATSQCGVVARHQRAAGADGGGRLREPDHDGAVVLSKVLPSEGEQSPTKDGPV